MCTLCLFSCEGGDNSFPCWTDCGICVTGHEVTEDDTQQKLAGYTTLNHDTQQEEEEDVFMKYSIFKFFSVLI